MFCRSISWFICMFVVVFITTVCSDPESSQERSVMESVREVKQLAVEDLGALLDEGDGAFVTLVAGDTRLAAHRAVLAARSPVLAGMLHHYAVEASGGQLSVPDVEGPVLRHLLAYLYTLRAPQIPGLAPQLLAAADRFGLPALKADCERQVAAQLSVETAANVAVLAVRHSFNDLRDAAISFIKDHFVEVLATRGWGNAVVNHPKDVVEVSRLLASRLAETSAPATPTTEAGATPTTEARATPTTRPHSDISGRTWTALTAVPPGASRSTPMIEDITASRLPSPSNDELGRSLIEAAEDGAVDELQSLLEAGADVGARDEGGSTALHWAAYRGHAEAARTLLDKGADVNATDSWQNSPLHAAAWSGHAAVVRLLVAAGADPNARDQDGRTPLHMAVLRGYAEVATALLEAGADREATDQKGNTPLDVARHNNRQQLIGMLSAPSSTEAGTAATTQPPSAPTTAAPPGSACPTSPLDEATVARLRSLSVVEKNKMLREAAWAGRVAEVRSLLAAGADVHVKDNGLWTAVDWATMGPVEMVHCLLDAGGSVDTRDGSLYTPLHWAAIYGNAPVVRVMAAASSNLNARDKWGYTPLHWAAWNGNAEVAAVLLEAGADKGVRDATGSTPLQVARSRGHQHLVAMLTSS